jgi:hypothetical protein
MVENVTGQAEIRHLYKISHVGTVAGSYVTSGLLKAEEKVRLAPRSGVIVYDGKLAPLKRFKDDVKEVKEGYECGLSSPTSTTLRKATSSKATNSWRRNNGQPSRPHQSGHRQRYRRNRPARAQEPAHRNGFGQRSRGRG